MLNCNLIIVKCAAVRYRAVRPVARNELVTTRIIASLYLHRFGFMYAKVCYQMLQLWAGSSCQAYQLGDEYDI
jgi:hypothetical protein